MYVGRTYEELELIPVKDWDKTELEFFRCTMEKLDTLLSDKGHETYELICQEIGHRGGLSHDADWKHGTRVIYD